MLDDDILKRLEHAGDTSPGALNLAADIVRLCMLEAESWTKRADDAIRIPDMFLDTIRGLRCKADCAACSQPRPTVPGS